MTNRDFRDLLAALSAHSVRFLIVGGYAVTFHSRPRFTKALDVWAEPSADNAARTFHALDAFGAPLQMHGVTPQDFATVGTSYQIGLPRTASTSSPRPTACTSRHAGIVAPRRASAMSGWRTSPAKT